MKIRRSLLIATALSALSFAAQALPPKGLSIPFSDQAINGTTYEGLQFNYDMKGCSTPGRKIICELKNTYKSWLEFSDGAIRESNVYGDNETIILTNVGKSGKMNDNTDVFHADQAGYVRINDIKRDDYIVYSTASCHYEFDNGST